MSKAEARARKKAERQARFEASKPALLAKVNIDGPKIRSSPEMDDAPRLAPHLQRAMDARNKNPKAIEDGSRFPHQVTWCITKADQDGSWTWGELRAWSDDEWNDVIYPKFLDFESKTWREIDALSSGTGHKMHHGHEISDLEEEAQLRWIELDLEQYESVFRFRLGGKLRAWGFIVQAHFFFVWWDRKHLIYPVGE